jgi:hypothetical protein
MSSVPQRLAVAYGPTRRRERAVALPRACNTRSSDLAERELQSAGGALAAPAPPATSGEGQVSPPARSSRPTGRPHTSRHVWTTSTSSGTVPDRTEEEQAQAQGEQDAAMALAEEDHWQIVGGGMLTVHPVEESVPRAHRCAYLDGPPPCSATGR